MISGASSTRISTMRYFTVSETAVSASGRVPEHAVNAGVVGQCVVANDDPLAIDPDDGVPGNAVVGVVAANAEVLEAGVASDAEPGDAQHRRRQLTAEVVAAAERPTRSGDDLAAEQ
jgi:hypothetical protein